MWHVVQVSFLARQEEGTKLGAARTRQKCQVLGRKLGTQTLNNQWTPQWLSFALGFCSCFICLTQGTWIMLEQKAFIAGYTCMNPHL